MRANFSPMSYLYYVYVLYFPLGAHKNDYDDFDDDDGDSIALNSHFTRRKHNIIQNNIYSDGFFVIFIHAVRRLNLILFICGEDKVGVERHTAARTYTQIHLMRRPILICTVELIQTST